MGVAGPGPSCRGPWAGERGGCRGSCTLVQRRTELGRDLNGGLLGTVRLSALEAMSVGGVVGLGERHSP